MAFLVKSSGEVPPCPKCGGTLTYRDSRMRIWRRCDGSTDHLVIRRLKCEHCGSYHNELPDCLVPHKHYDAETIAGVLDGLVVEGNLDTDQGPCDMTIRRWHRWFSANRNYVEGYLRNLGAGLLGLGEAILFWKSSLLDSIKNDCLNWLELILRFIYNSGGFLPAFY